MIFGIDKRITYRLSVGRSSILDFLCIHPFNDGNGRMRRLLTLLLLYQSGYLVRKYISIEKLIEKTKDTYYETLQANSVGWNNNSNDYAQFVKYYLAIVLKAYGEFEKRMQYVVEQKLSKSERIKNCYLKQICRFLKNKLWNFTRILVKLL